MKQQCIKQEIPADFDEIDEENRQQLTEQIPSDGLNDVPSSQTVAENEGRLQRIRKRSTWTIDYEIIEIDQSKDPLTFFALFFNCDPIVFEETIKDSKWQKTMDEKVATIERTTHGS